MPPTSSAEFRQLLASLEADLNSTQLTPNADAAVYVRLSLLVLSATIMVLEEVQADIAAYCTLRAGVGKISPN